MPRPPRARALTLAELELVNTLTAHNASAIDSELSKLAILASDADVLPRRAARRCRACEYLKRYRLAGQMFTAWSCRLCAEPQPSHHNTAVPRLCMGCAAAYGLCAECGGDIETRHRGRKTGRKPKRVLKRSAG